MNTSDRGNSAPVSMIAVPRSGGDLFATATSDGVVTVWSLAERRRVLALQTLVSIGGSRLAVLVGEPNLIVAGSWEESCLTAYDCATRTPLWRKHLTGIQQVCDLSLANSPLMIGVGMERGPFQVLSGETGATIMQVRNVKETFQSRFADLALQASRKAIRLCKGFDIPVWNRRLNSFALLDASLSPEDAVYSEAAGGVYCCDFNGNELWRFEPERGWHALRLAWDGNSSSWIAAMRDYEGTGSMHLCRLSGTGSSTLIADIEAVEHIQFLSDGSHAITSRGYVISTASGEVVWHYAGSAD